MSKEIKDKQVTIKIEDKGILSAFKRRSVLKEEMDRVNAERDLLQSEADFLKVKITGFLKSEGHHKGGEGYASCEYLSDNIDKGELVLKYRVEDDSDSDVRRFLSKLLG